MININIINQKVNPNLALNTSDQWSDWFSWGGSGENFVQQFQQVYLDRTVKAGDVLTFSFEFEVQKRTILDNINWMWFPQSSPPSDTVKNITGWGITIKNDIPHSDLGVTYNVGQLDTRYDGNTFSFGLRIDNTEAVCRFRKLKVEYGTEATLWVPNKLIV